ncbi:MAG TPA: hypothetical protein PK079_17905 [Leptospiraceae bacterium]|nr:hypothetical protein [Leptospiraceae bacterium]HMW05122.1 hypothetical protein [Leptospiraceae bacterium]HMY31581.1 hypothetical protein [Leptospiraceae bacterium]HMZ66679.1 hypothetical protein [Leptospiraceae bacterium]HNA09658.1 hypothetical protein [Leptospiraceae bacterium]
MSTMHNAMRFLTLLLLIFSIKPVLGLDTTIVLKDGEILKVDLIDENDLTLIYKKKNDGVTGILAREEVLKIIYKDLNQDEISQIRAEEKIKIIEYRKLKKKKKIENKKNYEMEMDDTEYEPAYIQDREEIPRDLAFLLRRK